MYIFVEQILSMETLKTWVIHEKRQKKFYPYYFKIKPLQHFSELFFFCIYFNTINSINM